MLSVPSHSIDYQRAIPVANGIHWVGVFSASMGLHCNPYLIVEGEQAVLIDPGSRPDFSAVVVKILDIIEPVSISAIVLQHYDPDLCGCVPILEDLIGNPDLRIISHQQNIPFIKHYGIASPMVCFEEMDSKFTFASGRELRFHRTPFAHSAGTFMTHDVRTGVLFTSDLFGSFARQGEIFLQWRRNCTAPDACNGCHQPESHCPLPPILEFHRQLMPSGDCLRYALTQVKKLAPTMLAPQHGSIIFRAEDIRFAVDALWRLDGVGIDAFEVPER